MRKWLYFALFFTALGFLVTSGVSKAYSEELASPMHFTLNSFEPVYQRSVLPDDLWSKMPARTWDANRQSNLTFGEINLQYVSIDGLPVRRDVALFLESGPFSSFYRFATTRFIIGGMEWSPVIGTKGMSRTGLPANERISRQGAVMLGFKSRF